MAIISSSIHLLPFKSSVIVSQLANCLSVIHTSQSSPIQGPQAQSKVQSLRFYRKCLEKKFPNLSTKASTSKIIELFAENPPLMKFDLLTATIPKR